MVVRSRLIEILAFIVMVAVHASAFQTAAYLEHSYLLKVSPVFEQLHKSHGRTSNMYAVSKQLTATCGESDMTYLPLDNMHPIRRRLALHSILFAGVAVLQGKAAMAAQPPKERIESVQAPSPGVALDMLITMKMARNLRELSSKIDGEDWGAVTSFLTSPWSSGTARFTKKNQV